MDERTLELIEKVLDEPSCYPEFQRKSRDARKAELIDWYEKYGEVNICYNLYGMDRTCAVPNDQYLDRGLFRKQRHDVNARFFPAGSKFPYDYTLLMRDKLSFEMFMQSVFGNRECYCASVAYLIGFDLYEHCVLRGCVPASVDDLMNRYNGRKMVIKQTFGCSAEGVKVVQFQDGYVVYHNRAIPADDFFEQISASNVSWLIQSFICQHEILNKLNESSVNTLRVLTYHTGNHVEIGHAIIRFGKTGADVDNADQGGIMTGIDAEGKLMPYAFSSENKTRFVNPYAGLAIPFFAEAKELVRQAHGYLPGLFTIGWDVAFTPTGPLIIEGNDGWDPYSVQMPEAPLRSEWDHYYSIRKTVFGD